MKIIFQQPLKPTKNNYDFITQLDLPISPANITDHLNLTNTILSIVDDPFFQDFRYDSNIMRK